MKGQITLQRKKEYIQWFTNTCLLKEERTRSILEALLNSGILLSKVRLVENIRFAPNAILLSAKGAKTVSYLCRLNGKHIEDIDLIIYELLNNPPEEIYLWVSFNREEIISLGQEVVEGKSELAIEDEFKNMVQKFEKGYTAKRAKKRVNTKLSQEKILRAIDGALDTRDKETFLKLAEQYKKIANS